VVICGREFSVDLLRRIEDTAPGLSRRALARQVCQWLDWRGPSGQLQEMTARKALCLLARRQHLQLPAAPPPPALAHRLRRPPAAAVGVATVPVAATLADLGPIDVQLVTSRFSPAARAWTALLDTHHYLGRGPLCGAQLRYLIRSAQGLLGGLSFSAAAWQLKVRDQWIGWTAATRREQLHRVIANSRFLLVPHVPNLASHVLHLVLRRLSDDWQARYGYAPLLVETFVDATRFAGTVYRAANWRCLGQTAGRGRNGARTLAPPHAPKHVFVWPLVPNARDRLAQPPASRRLAPLPAPAARRAAVPRDWADEELGHAAVGDARLRRRLCRVARDFYARPQAQIPQACGSRAHTKATYRLMAHPRVTMDVVLSAHYQATAARVAREAVVLAVQDTTTLDYSAHPATTALGPIGCYADGLMGLVVHDTMAFTVDGTPLGLLDVQCWARDPRTFGQKHQRRAVPFAQKESVKWQRSLEAVTRLQAQCPHVRLVSVGDREADIYDIFQWAHAHPAGPALVIRAAQNRRVQSEHAALWPHVQAQPVAGRLDLQLPRAPARAPRQARMDVRFAAVTLRAPTRRRQLPPLAVWAVHALEREPPAGSAPIEWMLLTTCPVETLPRALETLRWYAGRWGIELFHRTLKSGCRIETRQLGSADRLEACLAIDLIVAWRIHHVTKLGRATPDVPCTVYFDDLEWQALVAFLNRDSIPPPHPPTLREAIRLVASLGGFLGRRGDGEPGTQTIWLGLQRLDDITAAWKIFSGRHPTVSRDPPYG
jgi:hypothetical protein